MTTIRFPATPCRAIVFEQLADKNWIARFAGDQWTDPWRTEAGPFRLVWDAATNRNQRRGLPIVRQTWPDPGPARKSRSKGNKNG